MNTIMFEFDWVEEIWADFYTVKDEICVIMWFKIDEIPQNRQIGLATYITKKYDWDWDALVDPWFDDVYLECPHRYIPDEYLDLDDYYKNPDNPKMTPNIHKLEFCGLKNNTDDYSCDSLDCPREDD